MIALQQARRYECHRDERSRLRFNVASGGELAWSQGEASAGGGDLAERQTRVMEVYEAHASSLYRYLRSLGLARVEAEDAIQEIFLRLSCHFTGNRDADINLRAWLFQVAHNLSMDVHRANRRVQAKTEPTSELQIEPTDPKPNPERVYLEKERMRRFSEAVDRLTPQQRNGILLRAQGMRYMEIATALAVSESRAIALVKRGLARIAGGL